MRRVLPDPEVLQINLQACHEKSPKDKLHEVHVPHPSEYLLDVIVIIYIEMVKQKTGISIPIRWDFKAFDELEGTRIPHVARRVPVGWFRISQESFDLGANQLQLLFDKLVNCIDVDYMLQRRNDLFPANRDRGRGHYRPKSAQYGDSR